MWILLTLALAASAEGTALVQPDGARLTPSQEQWFRPRAKPFGSAVRLAPAARVGETLRGSAPTADPPTMNCAIRVFKADPGFDAEIARPAPPDLDPKIVRPSPCRK